MIVEGGLAGGDPFEDLEHAGGANPAGHALAATLFGGELEEELGEVHHAGGVVHHDHAAGAHHGAGGEQALEIDGLVQQ